MNFYANRMFHTKVTEVKALNIKHMVSETTLGTTNFSIQGVFMKWSSMKVLSVS